jgi:membrane-associated phospholipid phosphatase
MDMERKYYFKVVLIVYMVWIIAFEAVGRFAATLETHNPTLALDLSIPLIPGFVWIYELCYLFPFLPLFLVRDFHRLNIALLSIFLANVSAFVVYLIYPIAFPRPELGASIAEKIIQLEYSADFSPGANNLPSLHVTFAWFVYFTIRRQKSRKLKELIVLLFTIMITLSTLFIKQHLVVDVIAGILWAFGFWALARFLYPRLTDTRNAPATAFRQMLRI